MVALMAVIAVCSALVVVGVVMVVRWGGDLHQAPAEYVARRAALPRMCSVTWVSPLRPG